MEVLSFPGLVPGEFVSRPNRFVAVVRVGGEERRAHVHDPGRLAELLRPGARVLLLPKKGARTDFHLIAVRREGYGWVFTHSGYHSFIAQRIIESHAFPEFRDVIAYGKELRVDHHRIDFVLSYHTGDVLMEVKGCTLFRDGLALFPDAPTKRGRDHVEILADYGDSILLFLVMNDSVRYFAPNAERDPDFHKTFLDALSRGVHVVPATFSFDGKTLRLAGRIPFISEPYSGELRALAGVAADAVREYNKRFSPEARAVLSGVYAVGKAMYLQLVFHGVFCQSCGLYDYFEDYEVVLEETGVRSTPESVKRFGDTFLVRFKVRSPV
ncbi:TPA: DNA/RNA nuclease SfsA [Candidatus Micrarchaeota archaeon]|nr:DNA/RNA nuclease SfsA [Candidatus Micrarchaeota archaeon]